MSVLKLAEERLLRYDFSASETHDLSIKLANRHQEKGTVEADKKAAMSQFDSTIKQIAADIDSLSSKVSSGHEFRKVECKIEYHKPEQGRKRITRSDTNEVWDEKMTQDEWNLFTQEQMDEKMSEELSRA